MGRTEIRPHINDFSHSGRVKALTRLTTGGVGGRRGEKMTFLEGVGVEEDEVLFQESVGLASATFSLP